MAVITVIKRQKGEMAMIIMIMKIIAMIFRDVRRMKKRRRRMMVIEKKKC